MKWLLLCLVVAWVFTPVAWAKHAATGKTKAIDWSKYELMPAQTTWWKNYPCGMVTNTSLCKDGKKVK